MIVCGSSGQMPKAVREALIDCLTDDVNEEYTALSPEEAEAYLVVMEKQKRYQQETW